MDFSLVYCPTRKAMIEKLNDWFERNDPDVIIGWNVIQFDLRVLQKTANDCGTQLLPGRERGAIDWRTHPGKQGYLFASVAGRVIVRDGGLAISGVEDVLARHAAAAARLQRLSG